MVSRRKRANSSVGNKLNNLTDRVVEQQKLQQVSGTQTNAVTNDSIAPSAVNSESVADRAITSAKIGRGEVTSENLGVINEIVASGGLDIEAGVDGHLSLSGGKYEDPYDGIEDGDGYKVVAFDPTDNTIKVIDAAPPAESGLRFDTTYTGGSTAPGMLSWNSAEHGLEFQMADGGVTLQIGQEEVVRVVNDETTTLTNGTVVYVSGSQGQRLKVKRADYSSDSTSAAILGVVTHAGGIATNQEGFVTVSGLVHGLNNVRTADGFSDGSVLWLAASGSWTATKPSATDTDIDGVPTPHHMVQVGYVVKASNGNAGVIYVHPQNGYELDELHNVAVSTPVVGQTLTYDSSGLWVNSGPLSQNYLLNGAFDIWQRGTTFSTSGYCADRWYFEETGTCTITQVQTPVPIGSTTYALRASATTISDSADIYQCLESHDVFSLRGKKVTFSCYIQMDANMIAQSGAFELKAYYSNVDDARTSQTTLIGSVTLTKSKYSSYAIASYTFTVPTGAYGLKVAIEPPLTVSPTSATYYVTQAMLEVGPVATTFRRNGSNLQAELAACQRFYERVYDFNAPGFQDNSSLARGVGYYSVPKRGTVAISASDATVFGISARGTDQIIAMPNANIGLNVSGNNFRITYAASTVTAGEGLYFYISAPDDSTKYIELSAEL